MKIHTVGVDDLKNKMVAMVRKVEEGRGTVTCGYMAAYAIWVHENLSLRHGGMKLQGQPRASGIGVYWGPHGQPKFLEQPARELIGEMGGVIREEVKRNGGNLVKANIQAMLLLMRESKKLVPVEYGFLKNSAFIMVDQPGKQAEFVLVPDENMWERVKSTARAGWSWVKGLLIGKHSGEI